VTGESLTKARWRPERASSRRASVSEHHVTAAVVHWSAHTGAEVVDEELLLALDAVLPAMRPDATKLRINPKSR
jgi:hypothetical protein